MEQKQDRMRSRIPSRRTLLRGAALLAAAPVGALASQVLAAGPRPLPAGVELCTRDGLVRVADSTPLTATRTLKLAWNPNAVCVSPAVVAQHKGFFGEQNLIIELVSYAGSTEQLLESLATGKVDAGIGMALRWLKALEQGFDVKLVAGTHGGCMRLLGSKAAGVTSLADLRGKTVGVSDMASPAKNFFSILAAKRGIDPVKDIEWRQYPPDLLAVAVEKGEIQALGHWDPDTYRFLKSGDLVEIATNLSDEYARRLCCVLGVRGSLLRDDRPAVRALTAALLKAHDYTFRNPREAAEIFVQYSPKVTIDDVVAMLTSQTHNHSPIGKPLTEEIALYAEDLKVVGVLKPSTDTARFANRVTEDVLLQG